MTVKVSEALCCQTPGESYVRAGGLSSNGDRGDKSPWQLGAKPELHTPPTPHPSFLQPASNGAAQNKPARLQCQRSMGKQERKRDRSRVNNGRDAQIRPETPQPYHKFYIQLHAFRPQDTTGYKYMRKRSKVTALHGKRMKTASVVGLVSKQQRLDLLRPRFSLSLLKHN